MSLRSGKDMELLTNMKNRFKWNNSINQWITGQSIRQLIKPIQFASWPILLLSCSNMMHDH